MFRLKESSLPQDPTFPKDLKDLGYFITPTGLIRKIEYPDEPFQFYITNCERYNEVHREAVHTCIRHEVLDRLTILNLQPLYLPTLSTTKPNKNAAHLPILSTPLSELRQKRRIVVIMNQIFDDLGIFSYRTTSRDGGLDAGSAVRFVREITERFAKLPAATTKLSSIVSQIASAMAKFTLAGPIGKGEEPGILILNPGQLFYSYREGTAMTPTTWSAKPRKSAAHPLPTVQPENYIAGNTTMSEHLAFVFDKILGNEEFVAKGAELFLVGLGDGGTEMVKYLEANWSHLSTTLNIAALALTAPLSILPTTSHIPLTNTSFLTWLSTHARAWSLSDKPLNQPLHDPTPLPIHIPSAENRTKGPVPVVETYEVRQQDREVITEEVNVAHDLNGDESDGDNIDNAAETAIQQQQNQTNTWTTIPEDESDDPQDAYIYLFPCVSGGEEHYPECIMTTAYAEIAEWLGDVAAGKNAVSGESGPNTREIKKSDANGTSGVGNWGVHVAEMD